MMIRFSFDSAYGLFSDALHLPDDHSFTDADIEAMKKQRFEDWLKMIEAPPTDTLPVDPQLIEPIVSEE